MRLLDDASARLDESAVISFFDGRAQAAVQAGGAGDARVTLLQDRHGDVADRRHEVEVRTLRELLPGLGLHKPRTLDVGCGSGRLYFALADLLGLYLGVDGAPTLIEAARDRCGSTPGVRFAVQDLGQPGLLRHSQGRAPFELVLCSGILIYLNAESVLRLLSQTVEQCAPGAALVLREPVGITQRLSLVNHWSDELGSSYNAIYRTVDEIEQTLRTCAGTRLQSFEWRWLYDEDALNNRRETRQALMVARLS